jgi:predicted transcriptional regulator
MSAPFSLRLDPELKARLEAEARNQDRSASHVAAKAIEMFLDVQDAKRLAIERALDQADAGAFVSAAAVQRWMESWDSDQELLAPRADLDLKRP